MLDSTTITDEQIKELRRTESPVTGNIAYACSVALGEVTLSGKPVEFAPEYVAQARARCAAAWNARYPDESKE